jgi:hypothetical protein
MDVIVRITVPLGWVPDKVGADAVPSAATVGVKKPTGRIGISAM